MKGLKRSDALRLLEESLVELSEARTSSPRSAEFKHWHEGAYQLAQRIWPKLRDRSARVARIPFRPGSSRANDEQKKEFFDRGCAEAGILLRKWIAEIQEKGIVSAEPDEDDVSTPAEAAAPEPAAPHAPPTAPPTLPATAAPPVAASSAPNAAAPAPAPPAARKPAAAQPSKPPKGNGKKRLKDMLGLDQLEASLGLKWKDDGDDAGSPAAPVQQATPTPTPAPPPTAPAAVTPPAPPAAVSPPPPPPVAAEPPAVHRNTPSAEDLGLEIVTTGPLRPHTHEEEDVPFAPPRGRSSFDSIEMEHAAGEAEPGAPTVIWSSTKPIDLGPAGEDPAEVVIETAPMDEAPSGIEPPAFQPSADLPTFIRPEAPAKTAPIVEPEPPGLAVEPAGLTELPGAPIVEPEPEGLAPTLDAPPETEIAFPTPEPPLELISQAPPSAAPSDEQEEDEQEEVEEEPLFTLPNLDVLVAPPAAAAPSAAAPPPPPPVAEVPRPTPPVAPRPTPSAEVPRPTPPVAPPPPPPPVAPVAQVVEIDTSDEVEEASASVVLISLAQEIERSTLPRRRRELLIEHLATIAGQVEEGDLEWAEVEDAIVLVMKHPDIARRVVPVLSRLLDQAA